MGALDSVVNELGNQFSIGSTNANSLLSGLLSFIAQQESGLSGFLDRFRRVGVGNVVSSWLNGESKSVSPETVETALGHDAISGMASKAGLSFSSAAKAIAFMLPRLIQRLAPGGAIPSRLPADMMTYVTGPTADMAPSARGAAQPATRGGYLWLVLALVALVSVLVLWLARRGKGFDADEQIRLASEKASAALANLRSGFAATDLVNALNLYIINFPTNSAQLPPESTAFLDKAAVAIKAAPPGTVIEIDGNTDNVGDANANMVLSKLRANAVRDYLVAQGVDSSMLATRGNGETRPEASNDTEEGRFHNRRIEFVVVK